MSSQAEQLPESCGFTHNFAAMVGLCVLFTAAKLWFHNFKRALFQRD